MTTKLLSLQLAQDWASLGSVWGSYCALCATATPAGLAALLLSKAGDDDDSR